MYVNSSTHSSCRLITYYTATHYSHAVVHVFGEKLAWGLGITSPDWQYAIDIHEDMLREEQEEREAEERALRRQEELVAKRLRDMENAQTKEHHTET